MAIEHLFTQEELTSMRRLLGERLHYVMEQMDRAVKRNPEVVNSSWWQDRVVHRDRMRGLISKVNGKLFEYREEARRAQG